MKFKKVIKEVLGDWRHWVGWTLSVASIYFSVLLILSLITNIHLTIFGNICLILFIFIPEVLIDLIKHWWELQ
jgi:hypothetical protein